MSKLGRCTCAKRRKVKKIDIPTVYTSAVTLMLR